MTDVTQKKLLDLTPEDFIAMYLARKLRPTDGNVPVRDGNKCCAVGAYAHDRYGPVPDYCHESFHEFYAQAALDLGVSTSMLTNFAVGFDRGFTNRVSMMECFSAEARHGYRVGEACRNYAWPTP